MKRCLVIGASGLVGEHLVNSLREAGEKPVVTYWSHPIPAAEPLNICDAPKVNDLIDRLKPGIIFLPAALTNVDLCEKNREMSYAINVMGAKNVADASNKTSARLIYFSTDYIFDGTAGPYNEDATPNPISEYGRQKLEAEHYITSTSLNHLIVRTTVVYGWERQGKNFVYRLVNSLRNGINVKVPMDQIGTPTYAPELAKSAIKLAMTDLNRVINIAGVNCISRYEFALEVAKIFKIHSDLILPVSTNELDQPAQRPLLAGLNSQEAQQLLKVKFSSSKEGLRLMLKHSTDFDTVL